MTDNLIERLVANLQPISPNAGRRALLRNAALGLTVSLAIMLLFLGIRHDLMYAITTVAFWTKLAYAFFLMAILSPAVLALSSPLPTSFPWISITALFICLMSAAFYQWDTSDLEQRRLLVWGRTALVCPWLIFLLSLPILALLLSAMKKLAPASPTRAGLAGGVLAGGIAVLIYSFHCPEVGIPFIAIWYTTGIVIAGFVGMISGRFLLRW